MTVNTNHVRRGLLPETMQGHARRWVETHYAYDVTTYVSPAALESRVERDTAMQVDHWRHTTPPPFRDAMRLARIALTFIPKRCKLHGAWGIERLAAIDELYSIRCLECRNAIRVVRALEALREALDAPSAGE